MKKRSLIKMMIRVVIILLAAIVLFALGTFIFHRIKSNEEMARLKEEG